MRLDYLDFDLLVERSAGRARARVLDSPVGQADTDFQLPFSKEQLEIFVLRAIGLGSRRSLRRIESPDMKEVKTFGGRLFESVFDGEVLGCLRRSLDEADRRGAGLRIRLRIADAPEPSDVPFIDVPWEFLFDAAAKGFLCLSDASPLVRYPDLPRPVKPLLVSPPLKVLAMVSSPHDVPRLDVAGEWTKFEEALGDVMQSGLVSVDKLEEATLEGLQRRLRRNEYNVFHFIGHGGFDGRDGFLVLEDESGQGQQVSGEFLRALFQNHRPLRLAVLNACEGARASPTDPFAGTAQSLVQGGVSAVIAMQFEITDEAAIAFSSEFYAALADGYPVDAALTEARTAIFTRVSAMEWAIPVLYMRSPDGRIFEIESPPDQGATPPRHRESTEELYREAQMVLAKEDWPRAAEKLEAVLALDSRHEEAKVALERARAELGRGSPGPIPPPPPWRRLLPLVGVIGGILVAFALAVFLLDREDNAKNLGPVPPNSLVQIDPVTLTLKTFPIDPEFGAKDIAITLDDVWVLGRRQVARFDPDDPSTSEVIPLEFPPHSEAVDLGASTTKGVWVIFDDSVSRIDPDGPKIEVASIPLGYSASSIAVSKKWIWVLSTYELLRINPEQVEDRQPIQLGGDRVSLGEGGVWVAGARTVRRIHPETLKPDPPIQLSYAPDGIASAQRQVWVFNTSTGTVTKIDPSTQTSDEPISIDASPVAIRIGLDYAWTANGDDGTITRIDLESLEQETILLGGSVVTLGVSPEQVSPEHRRLWAVVTE